jgi:hypothetical protein
MKQKTFAILLIVLAIGLFFWSRSSERARVESTKKGSGKISSPSPKAKDQEKNPSNFQAPLSENLKFSQNLGFCSNEKLYKDYFISSELVKWILSAKPQKLVLPKKISSCFKSLKSNQFRIVEYDKKAGFIFDELGEITMKLNPEKTYASMQDLTLDLSNNIKDTGLPSMAELSRFLFDLGATPYDEIVLFSIQEMSLPRARATSGFLERQFGLSFIDASEFRSHLSKESKNIQVVLSFNPKKYNLSFPFPFIVLDIKPTKNIPIMHPEAFTSRFGKQKLPALDPNKKIYMIGESAHDNFILNYANFLRYQGFSDLYLLKGGLFSYNSKPLIYPANIPQMRTINIEDLQTIGPFQVIDTRFHWEKEKQEFFQAYLIRNVNSMQWLNATGTHPNEVSSKTINTMFWNLDTKKLRLLSEKTKLVFVGKSDADWTIPFLSTYLSIQGLKFPENSAFWLREGFTGIDLKLKLGLIKQDNLSKFGFREIIPEKLEQTLKSESLKGSRKKNVNIYRRKQEQSDYVLEYNPNELKKSSNQRK